MPVSCITHEVPDLDMPDMSSIKTYENYEIIDLNFAVRQASQQDTDTLFNQVTQNAFF